MSRSSNSSSDKQPHEASNLTLTAVALQDHWSRTLALGTNFGPRKVGLGPATRARQKHEVKSVIDTGRNKGNKKVVKEGKKEREYVLDEKPPPLSLAQKFGLVSAPKSLLSEQEWGNVKAKSNQRDDSGEPCVICKEDFGLQEQVLLSCTHVFHRACLQAFERFTGKKTCPMCRHEQYQTRVIHEGARVHRHRSAAIIQSQWRGYVVRSWYKQLRETVPPKDPMLKKKFYEEKLSSIVDRMIKSIDVNMVEFLREIDSSVQQSRDVFRQWDAVHNEITEEEWEMIQFKALERGDIDCPICLSELSLYEDNCPRSENDDHNHLDGNNSGTAHLTNHKSQRKNKDLKLLHKITKPRTSEASRYEDTSECGTLEKPTKDVHKANNGVSSKPKKTGNTEISTGHSDQHCQAPQGQRRIRSIVLLSCTHLFHSTCLQTLEELAMLDMKNTCPVCRTHYQKRVLQF